MRKQIKVSAVPARAEIETVLSIMSMIVSLIDAIYTLIMKIFGVATA